MSENFAAALTSELEKMHIFPDNRQIWQFKMYYELLCKWNEKVNLTAVTGEENVIRRHFADSLVPMLLIPDWKSLFSRSYLIDVGTGAGFPGIPLKVMNPQMRVTLIDSIKKRTLFLNEVIRKLSLSDTEVLHGRVEDLGKNEKYREQYDICASRAVADLSVLSEYCLPLVRKGGFFTAYKAADISEELSDAGTAIALLGGELRDVINFDTPDGGRCLVVIEKKGKTPEKYPRKAGKPVKKPIGN